MGADMDDGTLLSWRVKPGDHVKRGDVLAVVDTEKAALDVESLTSGVVETLMVEPGTKVPVGTVLATILAEGEAAEPEAPKAAEAEATRTERVRGAVALAMARSNREIPHYYLTASADLGALEAWLAKENQAHRVEERVLLVAPLLKATALALKATPGLNGFYREDHFEPSGAIHLGVATALRGGGVLVPAIRDLDKLTVAEVMVALRDVVARVRGGGLRSSEVGDATVTVTSLAETRADELFGVIYPPQVALVGFGGVARRPVAIGDRIESRPVLRVTLAADHRVTDGHLGARFLSTLVAALEAPSTL
jgi:pyruvate dehydrogenase E2 component (dihydrolipoamide acetyltransferase)